MASNRLTEGVGKKIVEALKMQSEIEVSPNTFEETEDNNFELQTPVEQEFSIEEDSTDFNDQDIIEEVSYEDPVVSEHAFAEPVFAEPVMPQLNIQTPQQFAPADLDDFEIPSNVAVLKQLITKLPAGVTKQTGALIIKQTMEALGISMKSVLQEAQQVQESLNISSRECQNSIIEHRKQIGLLEKQAQKYQRQYAALNDIISLFVQTNI